MTSAVREVVVNGRFLGRPISGVERFGREIVLALDRRAAAGTAPPLRILAPPGVVCDLPLAAARFETVGTHGGHIWEQFALARAARGATLLSLANSGPVAHTRQLVVIHDAAPYRFPEAYGWRYRLWHRALGKMLARRAHLATVSQFSRAELAHFLHMPAENIAIVPNGSDHLGRVAPDPSSLARLALEGRRYLLAVGSANRNKNLPAVLAAWRLRPVDDALLVVAGAVNNRIFTDVDAAPAASALFPGRVDDATLAALYAGAAAFVFPSRYEGFGIPPLEAMAYGTPVLAADIAPVREVCGDAASYFAPDDPAALAALITQALSEPRNDPTLDARAAARLAAFRWDDSARALLDAIDLMGS